MGRKPVVFFCFLFFFFSAALDSRRSEFDSRCIIIFYYLLFHTPNSPHYDAGTLLFPSSGYLYIFPLVRSATKKKITKERFILDILTKKAVGVSI